MELQQQQVQQLNQHLMLSASLLQMNAMELEEYLQELSQENPVVELENRSRSESPVENDPLVNKLRWLESNDTQNSYYTRVEDEELDPLSRVGSAGGLEETLPQFLNRQLERMDLDEDTRLAVRFLAECLDEDGYLRNSPEQVSADCGIAPELLRRSLALLQTLEPAGVGAADLSQCLRLQLERISERGLALDIVLDHLEDLARNRYHNIAVKLNTTVSAVLDAQRLIRQLEPRPGAVFQQEDQVSYIFPDVFVEEKDGALQIRLCTADAAPFRISPYYQKLLAESREPEVRTYLTDKLYQAKNILRAIERRQSTLLRCTQLIVSYQEDFFRCGPSCLYQLRMTDAAQELELHVSTISRVARGKYLQCRWGVFPLSYFFSRGAAAPPCGDAAVGKEGAYILLRRLIDEEDKRAPLSDQKLSEAMEQLGCPISRRTVAKYREALNIPGTSGRRNRT